MGGSGRRGFGVAIGLLGGCSQGVGSDGPGQDLTEGAADESDDASEDGPMPATGGDSSTAADDGSGGAEADDGSGTGPSSTCGDGVVEGVEVCDDGNAIQGDGCNVDCVASGSIEWSHSLASGLADLDVFRGVSPTNDGAFVVGSVATVDSGRDVVVRRYGSAGSLEFTTTFDAGALVDEEGFGIAAQGETVYVAGRSNAAEATDGVLARLDAEGNVVWAIAIDGGLASADELRSVAIGPDAQPVVGGYQTVIEAVVEGVDVYGLDGWIAKYDATGTAVWAVAHAGDAGSTDLVEAVTVDGSGNVIAAGWESSIAGGVDVWVGKYDPDGNPLWSQSYDGTESLTDHGFGVAAGADGSIVVAALEGSSTIEEMWWVRRYDPDGNPLWTDIDPGSTGEGMRARAATISDAGTISVIGEERVAGARHIVIRKYASDGTRLWTTTVASSVPNDPYGLAIATDAGDALYVAGCLDKGIDGLDAYVARVTP